eukprot:403363096
MIDVILGQKLADASKTPGKTQSLNFFNVPRLNCQIVDCPGYGFAVASDVQKDLHRVIILVDSVTGLMDSDKFLMQMLTDAHRPFQIVLTKADKLREGQVTNKMKELGDSVKGMGTICSPILHAVCAKDGYGLQELMANIIYVLAMPILRKPV